MNLEKIAMSLAYATTVVGLRFLSFESQLRND
jgi:hypothetical protein